jgi:valyl-tRNA synthetase
VDFELAERHGLDMEPIIDLHGVLLPIAGGFAGLSIAEARNKIVARLEEKGLVTKIDEPYVHQIATAERTGAIVEPQVMRQWFIGVNREFERNGKTVTLKSLMQDAVRLKQITILPERFEKNYFYWIDNLRDWCISRQIWFGHQIPVWYRGNETYCGLDTPEGDGWQQDPDTLDTWFSSGLWTFSTLGWPDETAADFRTYHPTTILETGYDILFFWVARMILMSEYLLGTVPFKTVYLHGLVRDAEGRKMSKSLGNTIDPLDVAEQYGADALRLALIVGSTPGNDVKVGDEKFTAMRNFVNKLWNMGRYVAANPKEDSSPDPETDAEHWILFRLNETLNTVKKLMESSNLSLACSILQDFTWNDFADWYIETHKVNKNHAVLHRVYEILLRAWHPFMPFVTEALSEQLHGKHNPLLMGHRYPESSEIRADECNMIKAGRFSEIKGLIQRIRNVRAIYHIDPKEALSLTLLGKESELAPFSPIIERLGRISEVLITDVSTARPAASASITVGSWHAFVHLGAVINVATEKVRLEKERDTLEKYILSLKARLNDRHFVEKAPTAIIKAQRETLAQSEKKLDVITQSIQDLST